MSQIILIADKSITIQKIVELTFQEEDFEVIAASNGKEALEKMEQVSPSIILADISLPEINGYELCRIIREEPKYAKFSKLPVLLLAGIYETMDEQKSKYVEEKSKEVMSNGVLMKPFDPQDLIQKVKQMALPVKEAVEKIKEVEEVFQLEEEETKKEELKEKLEEEKTVFISDEEKRYIMGMTADKELSPELTGDIFEEEKVEEAVEFIEGKVSQPVEMKEEDLFLKEEEPEKEQGIELISLEEPIQQISAGEIPDKEQEAPVAIEDFIESSETTEESPLSLEEEAPLIIEEPVEASIMPEEEDILGLSELEEKEEEEEAEEIAESAITEEHIEEEPILEIEEPFKEIPEAETKEEIVKEQLEEVEEPIKIEEAIPQESELIIKEEIKPSEPDKGVIQERIDEIIESQLEKAEEAFVEPIEKEEVVLKEEEVKLMEQPLPETLMSDEFVDKIVEKVVSKMSTKILEEIAWQVVPDLAEKIIKRVVEKLKLKDEN